MKLLFEQGDAEIIGLNRQLNNAEREFEQLKVKHQLTGDKYMEAITAADESERY